MNGYGTRTSADDAEGILRDLTADGLRGARIGVARNFFGFNPRVDQIMEECIRVIRDLGAEIVDPVDLASKKDLEKPEFEVLLYEFKADLNAYLAALGPDAPVHSLAEVIEFNERHADRVMPYFGQEIMVMARGARAAHRREVPGGAGGLPASGAGRGDRRDAGEARAGRHHRAFRRPGLAHRLHLSQRRFGRQLVAGGRGGHSEHHRARRTTSSGCRSASRSWARPGASRN